MSVSSVSGFPDEDAWFHEKITREEAEKLLYQIDEDGSFLVRESTSSLGDYAISVFADGQVHHVQVKRHGEDAFFSVEDHEPHHGLDELIKFLQSESPDGVLVLKKPVIKALPPPDARRHGRTNLLHRATKEGSVQIVSEMLMCKNRSIDAKNDEGQTAAHLASMNGFPEILSLLVKAGTNVNAKDSSSCTPLHYACRNNHPEVVRILLQDGRANPQIRRNDNGWVPMHEATAKGHVKCIRMLYLYKAPLRPRTTLNEIPLHFALQNKKPEAVQFFDTVLPHDSLYNQEDWFHNRLGRQEAVEILRAYRDFCEIDPSASYYLVRRHSIKEDAYVLTIIWEERSYNFEIGREGNFLFIDDGPYLESLEHLVQHYTHWPDGLPCRLQVPVSQIQADAAMDSRPSLRSSRNSLDVPPPLPKRTPMSCSPGAFIQSHLGSDLENNNRLTPSPNPPAASSSTSASFSKENIPIDALDIGDILGEGEYGEVYIGRLKFGPLGPMDVAIKTLKTEGEMNEWKKNEFLTEARTMLDLEHPHIVKIIGICWDPKTYMVQELCELGSLQDFLLDNPDLDDPVKHFRLWAQQIAKGMVYLQRKRFIHRDLAVRNILLASVLVAKISDFGLSRALGLDSDYYTASQGGRWPIKWYAPESCSHGTFSHASDVWSYGITLWEIYSFGASPYEDLQGREVIEKVESGYRLEKPEQCSDQVYSVMRNCWQANPDLRPKFPFLENFFADENDNTENLVSSPSSSSAGSSRRGSSANVSVAPASSGGGAAALTTTPNIPSLHPPPLPKPRESGGTQKNLNETVAEEVASDDVALMTFDNDD